MSDRKTGLCLSVQQPWAWLIIRPDVTDAAARAELSRRNEIKPVENRSWRTDIRGWIGIHAGKKIDAEGLAFVRREFPHIPLPETFEVGGIVGRARIVDSVREHESPWFFGPHAFVLSDAEPLPFTPCRGQLGFFRPDLNFTAPGNSDPPPPLRGDEGGSNFIVERQS